MSVHEAWVNDLPCVSERHVKEILRGSDLGSKNLRQLRRHARSTPCGVSRHKNLRLERAKIDDFPEFHDARRPRKRLKPEDRAPTVWLDSRNDACDLKFEAAPARERSDEGIVFKVGFYLS